MTGAPGSRGLPLGYARDLCPLAAGSARRNRYRLVGTLLARIPEVNQECPRRLADSPRIAQAPRYRAQQPQEGGEVR